MPRFQRGAFRAATWTSSSSRPDAPPARFRPMVARGLQPRAAVSCPPSSEEPPAAGTARSDGGSDDSVLGSPSRRALFGEGVLAAASDAALPFLPVYLVALGATNTQVGLLAAATALAGLVALFPAAWLARRARSRKRVVLFGGWGFARLALIPIAAIPFFGHTEIAVALLIALGGLRTLAGSLSHPSGMAFLADVVPHRITGVLLAPGPGGLRYRLRLYRLKARYRLRAALGRET